MSLFVFSVLIGVLFHQLITVIQPLRNAKQSLTRINFGQKIVLQLPDRTYLALTAIIFSVFFVLFIGAAALIVAQKVHPSQGYAFRFTDALTSPRMAAAFFGFFVGQLVGNLINRIFRSSQSYELKSSDRLQVFLIVILIVLGIGGEEFIQSSARRISKISFGVTNEISFSDAGRASSRAAEQPRNAAITSGGGEAGYFQSGASSGLRNLGRLADIIKDDTAYLRILKKYDGSGQSDKNDTLTTTPVSPLQEEPNEFLARTTISPIAKCLAGVFARTADATYLNVRLEALVPIYQKLAFESANKAGIKEQADRVLVEQATEIFQQAFDIGIGTRLTAETISSNDDLLIACSPLAALICADELESNSNDWLGTHSKEALACLPSLGAMTTKPLKPVCDPKPNATRSPSCRRQYAQQVKEAFDKIDLDDAGKRPYISMAYAGLLAQLGYYEAASLALHNWLESPKRTQYPVWYVERARFALGIYLEEWIRSQSESAPLALRQYHIDNLDQIVSIMKHLPAVAAIDKLSGDYKFNVGILGATQSGDQDVCSLSNGQEGILLSKLYESYLGALSTFVDNALKHPTYKRENASNISSATQELIRPSLKCLNSSVQKEFRAEILERYVRNVLNGVENTSSFKSNDSKQEELKKADQLLRMALQLVARQHGKDQGAIANSSSFFTQISTSNTVEVFEKLLATHQRLQEMQNNLD